MANDARNRPAATAAEIYDQQFVPALFGHWGPVLVREAHINQGQDVLDIGCGTGAATLAALAAVGKDGTVTGLDASEEMLAVARRKNSRIDWRLGKAEQLPFTDRSFDAVISQFAMMFFERPADALREMNRVLRPGGRLAVAVCDAIDNSPGYRVLVNLLLKLFGPKVANAFRAPFSLGNAEVLNDLSLVAGLAGATVKQHHQNVRFASIASLISTERACVWTLGGMLDDSQFEQLLKESEVALKPFTTGNGDIAFDMPALIITATR